jgi:hypothetical protein
LRKAWRGEWTYTRNATPDRPRAPRHWPDGGEVDPTLGEVQVAAPGVTFPHDEVVAVRGEDLVGSLP